MPTGLEKILALVAGGAQGYLSASDKAEALKRQEAQRLLENALQERQVAADEIGAQAQMTRARTEEGRVGNEVIRPDEPLLPGDFEVPGLGRLQGTRGNLELFLPYLREREERDFRAANPQLYGGSRSTRGFDPQEFVGNMLRDAVKEGVQLGSQPGDITRIFEEGLQLARSQGLIPTPEGLEQRDPTQIFLDSIIDDENFQDQKTARQSLKALKNASPEAYNLLDLEAVEDYFETLPATRVPTIDDINAANETDTTLLGGRGETDLIDLMRSGGSRRAPAAAGPDLLDMLIQAIEGPKGLLPRQKF